MEDLADLAMTPRVAALKEKMLAEQRYVSIEQALITTEIYQANEKEPVIVRRALALRAALARMEIAMEPEELIVGNRTKGVRAGVVTPESGGSWIDEELETLPTRLQDTFLVREEDILTYRESILPYWKGRSLEDVLKARHGDAFTAIGKVVKINQTDHAQGHICPDCKAWLASGPAALRRQAEEKLAAAQGGAQVFYRAVALTMEGAERFMERCGALAERMADKAISAETRASLRDVAAISRALAHRPPETFHEALQSLWFLFVILQMESNASSFSPGRMDRYLYPFYRKDIAAGRLSRQKALELIECLWLKFNQVVYMRSAHSAKYFAGFPIGFNIAVGGADESGKAAENELSFLLLKAQEHLGLPQPNLSVRLSKDISGELLETAVRVVAKGSGMPQFFNDEAVIHTMIERLGIERRDALDYAIVGCVELTTQGNNLGWSDAAMFNLNKALELAMNHGRCLLTGAAIGPDLGGLDTFQHYAELETAFAGQIDYFVERMIPACEAVEKAHAELLPSPFLSAVIADCLEKGVDVTAGGAKYNLSGIQMIQAANVADSLAALCALVYEEKRVSGAKMLSALRENFAGHEILRARALNRVPKYGNDVVWVDGLGAKWARYFREMLTREKNYRGGIYHTGMYTVSAHVPMGENVGATPDGRLAGEPLADGGMSPVYGRDTLGPTAVLRSAARFDNDLTSNGGLLNMKFLPEFFETKSGVEKFAMFLRTLVELKIPHIQFNVLRSEDLLAAKREPEKFRGLTVRVAGYTAYFTELDGKLQDEIIARTAYEAL